MPLLLDQLVEPMLAESRMLAAHARGLIAFHRVMDQMSPSVSGAEVEPVVQFLSGHVIHGWAIAVVGEHHHSGEPRLLHQSIEILSQWLSFERKRFVLILSMRVAIAAAQPRPARRSIRTRSPRYVTT